MIFNENEFKYFFDDEAENIKKSLNETKTIVGLWFPEFKIVIDDHKLTVSCKQLSKPVTLNLPKHLDKICNTD